MKGRIKIIREDLFLLFSSFTGEMPLHFLFSVLTAIMTFIEQIPYRERVINGELINCESDRRENLN